ncbi:MAG: branched-chain amino acid ABC transporter permease [Chloroflexi bacterium]|nr:branched-chain amino acid ABC transporter permease [Chloroflexota bacterium]
MATAAPPVAQRSPLRRLLLTGDRLDAPRWVLSLVLLVAIVFPFISPSKFWTDIATEVFVFAVWAMSLDILVGYTGLLSFGHAAYFGFGAYAASLTMMKWLPSIWAGLAASIVIGAVAALVAGYFCVRASGIAFAMLTLAFAQMFYTVMWKMRDFTGGHDGLTGVPRPPIELGDFLYLKMTDRTTFYFFMLAMLVICVLVLRRIVNSPFGSVLEGIRENEERSHFLGYDARQFKLIAFVISGAFAGLSGGLYAMFQNFVSPALLQWGNSGNVLIMSLFGGVGTLVGPIFGAALVIFLQEYVKTINADLWQLIVGFVLMLVVLFMPNGLAGLVRRAPDRRV